MTRPQDCKVGGITAGMDRTTVAVVRDLAERLRASRDRLAASELARHGQAWRLWSVCVAQTVGYSREADQTFASALAREAGMHRNSTSRLLRRFDELDVFVWDAAPLGSHAASILRLPAGELHAPPTVRVEDSLDGHAPPTVRVAAPTRTPQGALHGNEQRVMGHDPCRGDLGSHEAGGCSLDGNEPWQADEPDAGPSRSFEATLGALSHEDLLRLAADSTPGEAAAIEAALAGRAAAPRTPREWR